MGLSTDPTQLSSSSSEHTTRKKCRFTQDELGALEIEFELLTSGECKDWSKVDRALWAFFDMMCRAEDFPIRFDDKQCRLQVRRLVHCTFSTNPYNKPFVINKNGNKNDFSLDNVGLHLRKA
jgi:hypothetical protein